MIRVAVLLCLLPVAALADPVLPATEVSDDTYITRFPDTGARIAVFDAGQGFREELFARDAAEVFDSLQPGQPPLMQADIIIARVRTWDEAARVYQDTPLHALSDEVGALAPEQVFHLGEFRMMGRERLVFTVLDAPDDIITDARCMARLVIDTLYTGRESTFDVTACSLNLD